MPDLSKIKLDGTTYNLKDSIARTLVIPITIKNGEMQPVGTTLIEAIEAFKAGRRIVLRNNNYDLYIDHTDNTSLEGTSNNPDGNGYFHITWDSNGLTGDSVGMPPKTTSDLINDSDFATTSEVNSLITSAIGNINSFEVSVVASLPTSDIDTHTIYFISNSSSGDSIYDEYMYINNSWEKIGSTAVDLSNYLQKTDISDWAKASTKPSYTASEVGAATSNHTHTQIGTNNVTGQYTVSASSSGVKMMASPAMGTEKIIKFNDNNITLEVYNNVSHIKSDLVITEDSFTGIPTPTENTSAANKKYVDDSIATITHPTNISAFNNDVGYLTSFTETDPTVPAWAKAATKPTYTASEVGAAASNHTHSRISSYAGSGDGYVEVSSNYAAIEASTNGGGTQNILKLTGTTTTIHKVVTPTADGDAANKKYVDDSIAAITHPTNVSTFTNDAGYLTLADLPIYDGTVV